MERFKLFEKRRKKTSCKFEILQPTVDLRLSGDKPNIQNLEPSTNRYKTDQTLIKSTKKQIQIKKDIEQCFSPCLPPRRNHSQKPVAWGFFPLVDSTVGS